ncbi:unnamed protein product [Phytophthora lilii]|uniref:Unnamed protein product n=1 Tax=Phytophthora lilii TaxID=2077276 RepID=A0A9W6TB60_9STRA|nr:unnamed protein product [Phytophthora lilii]
MLIATGWVLRRHYKDDALARMVMIGRKSPNTKNAAQRLEDAIFRSWVNPPKLKEFSVQTPKRVFGLLKLDEAGDGVLQSPIFTFWTTYLDYFNKANPGKKESIISALTASYSDEALVQILESAKKVPSTEKLATKLQAEQLDLFLKDRKAPSDVAALLKVQDKTDANWQLWKNYQTKFEPPSD